MVENIKSHVMASIAIFNSFSFHYEMFGFIVNYAHSRGYGCDIFTNTHNNMGWLDYYSKTFSGVKYFRPPSLIGDKIADYRIVFVTTDDDGGFDRRWAADNVICINHCNGIRRDYFKTYINIAKFRDSVVKDSFITCHNAINVEEKLERIENLRAPVVTIIGMLAKQDMMDYNRLRFIDNSASCSAKIVLNFIGRRYDTSLLDGIDRSRFEVNIFFNLDASDMFEILKGTTHLMVTYLTHREHGWNISGSLPLAFTTLCVPIISRTTNKYFGLQNAIEIDVIGDGSTDPIDVSLSQIRGNSGEYLSTLSKEREKTITEFAEFCDSRMHLRCN